MQVRLIGPIGPVFLREKDFFLVTSVAPKEQRWDPTGYFRLIVPVVPVCASGCATATLHKAQAQGDTEHFRLSVPVVPVFLRERDKVSSVAPLSPGGPAPRQQRLRIVAVE